MPDPFANYDSWLEAPYQKMYEDADREYAIAENSTYETDCCGVDILFEEVNFGNNGEPMSMVCPKCGEVAGIDVTPPDTEPDYEPDDYEPDDYEPDLDYYP